MIILQMTFQIKVSVYVDYESEAQMRSLFSLERREDHEGTQFTEWRRMGQTNKGKFAGWNLPGKRKNSRKGNKSWSNS